MGRGEEHSGKKEQKVGNVAIPEDRKILSCHYNIVFYMFLSLFSPSYSELYKLS